MEKLKVEDICPNMRVIFITVVMSVSVAGGERRLSRRAHIKTYLMSSASQQTLSRLSSMLVENDHRSNRLLFRIDENICTRESEKSQLLYILYLSSDFSTSSTLPSYSSGATTSLFESFDILNYFHLTRSWMRFVQLFVFIILKSSFTSFSHLDLIFLLAL